MKALGTISILLLLIACQSNNRPEKTIETEKSEPVFNFEQLMESLPTLSLPLRIDKNLLTDYPGLKISRDLVPKLSSPIEVKEIRVLIQVQGFGQKMYLLYYAYPTDSEVDDYDQMALVAFDELGEISTYLPLDIGGTGFASTQNWIKEDGEILSAVIAEMEEVEVNVNTYRLKAGNFTEARQLSKTFQDGSYQKFLDEL